LTSPFVRAGQILAALFVTGTVQTLLPQLWLPLGQIDLMMIAVGMLALRSSFPGAVWTAALGGLIQDGLAGGIIGLHAFAKTAVAGVLALISDTFAIRGRLARPMMMTIATACEAVIVRALLAFLGWPGAEPTAALLGRAGITGLVCGLGTVGIPVVVASWRQRRSSSGLRWD
jgi:rod shape-determining protein MreD